MFGDNPKGRIHLADQETRSRLNREANAKRNADKDAARAEKVLQPTDPEVLNRARMRAKSTPEELWDDAKVSLALLIDPEVPAKDADRLRAVELAGKAHGAFIDRVEVTQVEPLTFRGFKVPVIDGRTVPVPTLPAPKTPS